jgi:hypothetical protein
MAVIQLSNAVTMAVTVTQLSDDGGSDNGSDNGSNSGSNSGSDGDSDGSENDGGIVRGIEVVIVIVIMVVIVTRCQLHSPMTTLSVCTVTYVKYSDSCIRIGMRVRCVCGTRCVVYVRHASCMYVAYPYPHSHGRLGHTPIYIDYFCLLSVVCCLLSVVVFFWIVCKSYTLDVLLFWCCHLSTFICQLSSDD